MRDLVFTATFFLLAVPAAARPELGLLLWSWMDYMNPHRLCYSFAKYSIPFSMISAAVTMAASFVARDRFQWPWTRETLLMLMFILWMNFTMLFAINPQGAWIEWDRSMKIQLMILMTYALMRKRE